MAETQKTVEQLEAEIAALRARLVAPAAQEKEEPSPAEIREGDVQDILGTLDKEPTPGYVLARLIKLENEVHAASGGKAGTPAPPEPQPAAPSKVTDAYARS